MIGQWIIPYVDRMPDFWDEIAGRFGAHIQEVYFPVPDGAVPSGRSRQPETYLETFLRGAPLPKSALVNPIVLARPVEEAAPHILNVLRSLYDQYGICKVTVASPALARAIKHALPEYYVTASVLMGISRPLQALMVSDCVDAITVDNNLVRDLPGLTSFRQAFSGEVRLIVNEACIPGCPHRVQHFYEMGYGDHFPQSLCQQMLTDMPWLRLTGAWILPQHLKYYDHVCDSFKLAGRVTLRDPAKYMRVLSAYLHRQPLLARDIGGGPASVLDPIEIPDELYEFTLFCDKKCHQCPTCREFYEYSMRKKDL